MDTNVEPVNTSEPELYVISVAAELTGMHPQTLRQYDRLGLVTPQRSKGRGRRYSHANIRRLLQIQRMSQEDGINLAGIRQIIALQDRVQQLERSLTESEEQRRRQQHEMRRVFTADSQGYIAARNPPRNRETSRTVSGSGTVQTRQHWWTGLSPELIRLIGMRAAEAEAAHNNGDLSGQ